jgi:dTMP kinase
MDSSIAYQGAGRDLDPDGIAQISRWATGSLVPDLTVLLDLDPESGRARLTSDGVTFDKLEGEGAQFHERVRRSFLSLARRAPRRYLVVDARADAAAISEEVRGRLTQVLPLSERQQAEIEAERVERERLEREQQAAEDAERRRLEAERVEAERVEKEQRAAEEAESRRLEAETQRLEAERVEAERAEAKRVEAERAEAERVAAVEAERRRLDAEAAVGYVAQTLPTPEGGEPVVVNPGRDDTPKRRPRPDPPTEVDLGEELFSLGDDPWHPR